MENAKQEIINGLNDNEWKTVQCLYQSSEGNGHDFGFIEDLTIGGFGCGAPAEFKPEGLTDHQIAGFIGQASKKGIIHLYGTDYVNGDKNHAVTQFTIEDDFLDAIEKRRSEEVSGGNPFADTPEETLEEKVERLEKQNKFLREEMVKKLRMKQMLVDVSAVLEEIRSTSKVDGHKVSDAIFDIQLALKN